MKGLARAFALVALLGAAAAQAHVVYGTKTLQGLVAEADLVLHARILAAGERVGLGLETGGASRPTVEARVLEVLKGELGDARVRFAQHGHGVAPFAPGDETLLFLLDIERSRELDVLGRAGALDWVSLQEHGDTYPVLAGTRAALLAAVRAYVAAMDAAPEAREGALRRATVALLTSGDADLAASAVRDLVLAPGAPLVAAEDRPALLAVIEDPGTAMGVRAALLAELARRGLVDGDRLWLRLLSAEASAPDRITAIRAAGVSGGAAVDARLAQLLRDPDPDVAAAAASALGATGREAAAAPLARALAHGSEKVRNAAIRGLGRIGSPAAVRALSGTADAHPDPATRRRARAELDKRRTAP